MLSTNMTAPTETETQMQTDRERAWCGLHLVIMPLPVLSSRLKRFHSLCNCFLLTATGAWNDPRKSCSWPCTLQCSRAQDNAVLKPCDKDAHKSYNGPEDKKNSQVVVFSSSSYLSSGPLYADAPVPILKNKKVAQGQERRADFDFDSSKTRKKKKDFFFHKNLLVSVLRGV